MCFQVSFLGFILCLDFWLIMVLSALDKLFCFIILQNQFNYVNSIFHINTVDSNWYSCSEAVEMGNIPAGILDFFSSLKWISLFPFLLVDYFQPSVQNSVELNHHLNNQDKKKKMDPFKWSNNLVKEHATHPCLTILINFLYLRSCMNS